MTEHRQVQSQKKKEGKFILNSPCCLRIKIRKKMLHRPSVPLSFSLIRLWICNKSFQYKYFLRLVFKAPMTGNADPTRRQWVHLQGSLDKSAGSSAPNRGTWKPGAELWTQFPVPSANQGQRMDWSRWGKKGLLQYGGNLRISLAYFRGFTFHF